MINRQTHTDSTLMSYKVNSASWANCYLTIYRPISLIIYSGVWNKCYTKSMKLILQQAVMGMALTARKLALVSITSHINAMFRCEIKLFQNYFTGLLQLMNIFQHVQCCWNNYNFSGWSNLEITSDAWNKTLKQFWNNFSVFVSHVTTINGYMWNKSSSGDEIAECDLTYHLICLLIYRWTTTQV